MIYERFILERCIKIERKKSVIIFCEKRIAKHSENVFDNIFIIYLAVVLVNQFVKFFLQKQNLENIDSGNFLNGDT